MKTLVFFAAVSLSLPLAAFAARNLEADLAASRAKVEKAVSRALTESKTYGEYFKKVEPSLDKDTADFLREKFKGHESEPMKVKETGPNRFALERKDGFITWELKDVTDLGHMIIEVNHHALDLDPMQKPEEQFEAIKKAFPQTSAQTRPWSPFPQAEAQEASRLTGFLSTGNLGFLDGSTGVIMSASHDFSGQDVCSSYSLNQYYCQDFPADLTADQVDARFKKIAHYEQGKWSWVKAKTIGGCPKSPEMLHKCLVHQAQTIKPTPPSLLAYLNKGEKAHGPASTEATSDGAK